MPLYDQHLHSRHSFDSKADPAANVAAAIERGLAGLTFTEHFDTHPREWSDCVYDDAAYSATIESLRAAHGESLFIGKGIEVCYQSARMDFILEFLDRHAFDLVLLSVHYLDGRPVHRRDAWPSHDAASGTRRYLEGVLEAVEFCAKLHRTGRRVFSVLGHLDLVKRYTQRFYGAYDVSPCRGVMKEILAACLEADLVPEINTSTLRQGLDETMPNLDVVRDYAALGGTAMSIGSDAHRAEDIGAGLSDAAEMLRAAGIQHMAVFRQGKQMDEPLLETS